MEGRFLGPVYTGGVDPDPVDLALVVRAGDQPARVVRHDPACKGRGCPACTGLAWVELADRDADRRDNEHEAQAARDDHEYDWQTR